MAFLLPGIAPVALAAQMEAPPAHMEALPEQVKALRAEGATTGPPPGRPGPLRPEAQSPTGFPPRHRPAPPPDVSAELATLASLALPGAGQLLLGQRRWPLYAGIEIAAWLVHLNRRRTGNRLRTRYRDLAWTAARESGSLPRRDGDFGYFERLEQWTRSGAWDLDPDRAGVQPETDPRSFNGSIWALARDLYATAGGGEDDPGYGQALAYYERRAYPEELLWDWGGKEASLDRYVELIDQSDEALRTATLVLGAVVANHLFAAVDAFVSARLAAAPSLSASAGLRELPAGPALEWRLEIRP